VLALIALWFNALTPTSSSSVNSREREIVILSEGEAEVEGPASSGVAQPSKPRKTPAKRTPKHPLITIAQSPDKSAALAGLDRWRAANPIPAAHLAEDDILIDRMRGSATIWYRIRLNLRNIPEPERPPQQTPDPDDDPTRHWREATNPSS